MVETMEPDVTGEDELLAYLRASFTDAASYSDDILAPERTRAFDYYLGDVYSRDGKPEAPEDADGQSSFVLREVADTIHQMMPGIMRIFTSGEHVVEYAPRGPDDEEGALQRTDYVHLLLASDGNNWFTTLHDVCHDGLLKKLGIFKWYWDERVVIEPHYFTGLTHFQAVQLQNDPEIEVLEVATVPAPPTIITSPESAAAVPDPAAAPPAAAMPGSPPPADAAAGPFDVLYNMRVRRMRRRRTLRICGVPPEEFVMARDTRDIATTSYCAHRTYPTVSDLAAEGFDRALLEQYARPELNDFTDPYGEAEQRNPGRDISRSIASVPKSMWRVFHVEHYIRYDADGDGVAELHKVRTIGEQADAIISDEIICETPFAIWSPVRVPHAAVGMSVADQVGDLQDVKSQILRNTLDSLAQAIHPATAVVENAVNMEDVLNNEVGRIIRQQAPGMVQPLSEPFIGPQALGVLAYLDEVKAARTGITRASTGLDDKVLQSTTRSAVENTVERAQERVEMIARTFAETAVRDLFKGVLRSITQHQDAPRTVRLRGRWVEVDPRTWDADADVIVNVGLGRGSDQQRMQFLAAVAAKQEQAIAQLGPANPLVAPSQLRATYAEMLRLAGFKDAKKFFRDITPEDDAKMAAAASQNRQPTDPAMVLAKIEQMKAQADIDIAREKAKIDLMKAQAEDDRERDRMWIDAMLKAAEIQAKFGAQVDMAAMKAQVDRERSMLQARVSAQQAQQQDAPA
ncbi:hypothetical protein [Microcystis phage MJing1]|nr:hypothetical protein [Microcystis phage MJing1]